MDSIVGDTQGAVLYHWPTYVQLMCKRFYHIILSAAATTVLTL